MTGSALSLSATGDAPGGRRTRLALGRGRLSRFTRRWVGPVDTWRVPRGVGLLALLAFLGGSIAYGIVRGDHVDEATEQFHDVRDAFANTAGFRINSIALVGQRRLSRDEILESAGITPRTSLLFLDAADARAKLKANPWIAEATVLKLYPDQVRIGITERDAFALWQRDGKVEVISEDGTVVGPFTGEPFTKLPLVVGTGAAGQAKGFLTLLDKYPAVRSQLRAAVLVAERRWNVALANGIEVRLPETDVPAALDMLVKLDRDDKIFTRDIAAIDLRLPDRVTVQLSDDAAAARAEAMKPKTAKKKGGAA